MNNNQEFPIPVKGQYALWQIIGIWLAGGAPMWILGWLVYPALSLGLPPAEAALLRFKLLTVGLVWQFVLAMIIGAQSSSNSPSTNCGQPTSLFSDA